MGLNIGHVFPGGKNVAKYRKTLWQNNFFGFNRGKVVQAWRVDNNPPHAIQRLNVNPDGVRVVTTSFGGGGVAREAFNPRTGKCDLFFIGTDNKVYRAAGGRDNAQVRELAESIFGRSYGAKSNIITPLA